MKYQAAAFNAEPHPGSDNEGDQYHPVLVLANTTCLGGFFSIYHPGDEEPTLFRKYGMYVAAVWRYYILKQHMSIIVLMAKARVNGDISSSTLIP